MKQYIANSEKHLKVFSTLKHKHLNNALKELEDFYSTKSVENIIKKTSVRKSGGYKEVRFFNKENNSPRVLYSSKRGKLLKTDIPNHPLFQKNYYETNEIAVGKKRKYDLDTHIKKHHLTRNEFPKLAYLATHVVDFLHRYQEQLHFDIKPENFLLAPDGTLYFHDFDGKITFEGFAKMKTFITSKKFCYNLDNLLNKNLNPVIHDRFCLLLTLLECYLPEETMEPVFDEQEEYHYQRSKYISKLRKNTKTTETDQEKYNNEQEECIKNRNQIIEDSINNIEDKDIKTFFLKLNSSISDDSKNYFNNTKIAKKIEFMKEVANDGLLQEALKLLPNHKNIRKKLKTISEKENKKGASYKYLNDLDYVKNHENMKIFFPRSIQAFLTKTAVFLKEITENTERNYETQKDKIDTWIKLANKMLSAKKTSGAFKIYNPKLRFQIQEIKNSVSNLLNLKASSDHLLALLLDEMREKKCFPKRLNVSTYISIKTNSLLENAPEESLKIFYVNLLELPSKTLKNILKNESFMENELKIALTSKLDSSKNSYHYKDFLNILITFQAVHIDLEEDKALLNSVKTYLFEFLDRVKMNEPKDKKKIEILVGDLVNEENGNNEFKALLKELFASESTYEFKQNFLKNSLLFSSKEESESDKKLNLSY